MPVLHLGGNDLFDAKPEPSLLRLDEFLSPDGADNLYQQCLNLDWEQHHLFIEGKHIPLPRLTAWFASVPYRYSGVYHPAKPFPTFLDQLRIRLEHCISSELAKPVSFNSVLLNHYRDGSDSVSYHADDEPELGNEPVIASISLGATRDFCFRKNTMAGEPLIQYAIPLHHGDCIVMYGRSQVDWKHAIPKTASNVGPRLNLTFRFTSHRA